MLCSECNKNNAEIFINKIENGVSSMEGLCKECAKKKGIDIPPLHQKTLIIKQISQIQIIYHQ